MALSQYLRNLLAVALTNPFAAAELCDALDSSFSAVTPGTVAASKGVVVDANKDIAGFRFIEPACTNAITAFATGGQASATALTNSMNRITVCATAGDSVKVPASVAGMEIVVCNDGAAACDVFPATGDNINGLAANVQVSLKPGGSLLFTCEVAGTWNVSLPTLRYVSAAPSGAVAVQAETIFPTNQYTFKAGTLKTGQKIKIRGGGTITTANGTLDIRVRYGGVAGVIVLDTGAAITPANGDIFSFDLCLTVTDVGATGHVYGVFFWNIGTAGTGTTRAGKTASIAIDTTADKVLNVTQQLGTGAGSLTLDYLDVEIL